MSDWIVSLLLGVALFSKRRSLLDTSSKIDPQTLQAWLQQPDVVALCDSELHRSVQRQAVVLQRLDVQIIPVWAFPASLLSLKKQTPLALFVRGDASLLHADGIAMVGSRKASASAEQWAESKASEWAAQGKLVISGGALGIDAAAHRGALNAGGKTLVYFGAGADRVYPARHRTLFERILSRGGALITEHAPFVNTQPWHHAERNRFIAAQAQEVYVAEAALKSGSLGTALWAQKLNKPLYVSPPSVGSERGGLDALYQQGHALISA